MKQGIDTNKLLPHTFHQYSVPSCQKKPKTILKYFAKQQQKRRSDPKKGGSVAGSVHFYLTSVRDLLTFLWPDNN